MSSMGLDSIVILSRWVSQGFWQVGFVVFPLVMAQVEKVFNIKRHEGEITCSSLNARDQ